jgi:hypothetical protein
VTAPQKTRHPVVRVLRLGVDIGNVIMGGDNDALFGRQRGLWTDDDEKRMLAIPELPGATEAVRQLILSVFGIENVWLVSKARKNTEAKTWRWLEHHDFCARTSILPSHIWFCRDRGDKALICDSLNIGYFVDNRPDVLDPMLGIVPHRYLFGRRAAEPGSSFVAVPDWAAAVAAIRKDIPL